VSISGDHARLLDERGYVVLSGFIGDDLRRRVGERIQLLFAREGDAAGAEFKTEPGARRLANLVDKGDVFVECILEPRLLAYVGHVVGERFKLSSLNARSADPGAPAQPLHVDAGALPDARGYWVCNTLWMLDDLSETNGALRVVPGSHRSGRRPQQQAHADEVLVTGRAGDLVVMNAHLWHGGAANRTDRPRLALHAFYCRSDKPQQQYQKALLRAETQASLPQEARALLALDDPENDALCSDGAGASGFMR
jgi:hypothetical protein